MENKIAAKIVSDAVKMSNSTREEGSAKAQEIIERALNDVRIFREENMRETEILRREILERKESVARLEVKKLALKAKQRVLDTAFARALEAVRALPKDKYLKIIEGMLASAEDGDVVKIAECDAKTVTAAFVKKTAEKYGVKLTLSKEYADIRGGVILTNGSYDKNFSLETEFDSLREEIEPAVAAEIFGERK